MPNKTHYLLGIWFQTKLPGLSLGLHLGEMCLTEAGVLTDRGSEGGTGWDQFCDLFSLDAYPLCKNIQSFVLVAPRAPAVVKDEQLRHWASLCTCAQELALILTCSLHGHGCAGRVWGYLQWAKYWQQIGRGGEAERASSCTATHDTRVSLRLSRFCSACCNLKHLRANWKVGLLLCSGNFMGSLQNWNGQPGPVFTCNNAEPWSTKAPLMRQRSIHGLLPSSRK